MSEDFFIQADKKMQLKKAYSSDVDSAPFQVLGNDAGFLIWLNRIIKFQISLKHDPNKSLNKKRGSMSGE